MAAVGGARSARRRLVLGRIARGPAPSRSCTLTSSTGCDNLEEESGGFPVRGAGTKRLGTGPASGSRHWKATTSQPGAGAGARLGRGTAPERRRFARVCVQTTSCSPCPPRGGGVASSRWGRGGITAPAGVYCVREPGEGLGPSRTPPLPRVVSRYFPTNTVTFGGPEPACRNCFWLGACASALASVRPRRRGAHGNRRRAQRSTSSSRGFSPPPCRRSAACFWRCFGSPSPAPAVPATVERGTTRARWSSA